MMLVRSEMRITWTTHPIPEPRPKASIQHQLYNCSLKSETNSVPSLPPFYSHLIQTANTAEK